MEYINSNFKYNLTNHLENIYELIHFFIILEFINKHFTFFLLNFIKLILFFVFLDLLKFNLYLVKLIMRFIHLLYLVKLIMLLSFRISNLIYKYHHLSFYQILKLMVIKQYIIFLFISYLSSILYFLIPIFIFIILCLNHNLLNHSYKYNLLN